MQLFALEPLPAFQRYLQVLRLLEALTQADTFELLHSKPVESHFGHKEQERPGEFMLLSIKIITVRLHFRRGCYLQLFD